MELQKVLRMKEGVGQHSYANNSSVQKKAIEQAKSVIEESIKKVYHDLKPKCFMMADMGCSSGPNALLVVKETINVIDEACRSLNHQVPEFGVYLNDLPGNDFNTLFNFLPNFYKWLEEEKGSDFGPCFVSGTPKSFHERVFPTQFLHFVHSGYALHWLSKVPEGVGLNRGNIMIAKSTPPEGHKAFFDQFKRDFSVFLSSRAKEVVPGGCMVLTFLGRVKSDDRVLPELLGSVLRDMVSEGMIEEEKLDEFNIPMFYADAEQVRQLVEAEGSFVLNTLETSTVDWTVSTEQDPDKRGAFFARFLRAAWESLVADAFGEAIVDDFFFRLKMSVREHIEAGHSVEPATVLVASMTKKT